MFVVCFFSCLCFNYGLLVEGCGLYWCSCCVFLAFALLLCFVFDLTYAICAFDFGLCVFGLRC